MVYILLNKDRLGKYMIYVRERVRERKRVAEESNYLI